MTNINAPEIISFARMNRAVADLKTRADTARVESVTGRAEDITSAVNGNVGSMHMLQKAIDDSKAYQQTLSIAQGRITRTQTALESLTSEALRIGTDVLAVTERRDEYTAPILAADAEVAISTVFSTLNIADGGRYLFSGDATDRPPFSDPSQLLSDVQSILSTATDAADAEAQLDFYFNDPAGGFATNVYQGGENKVSPVEIGPGIRLDAAVKADAQPIKDLLRSLSVIASQSHANFGDKRELVNAAGIKTLSAEASITNMRAVVGAGEARIHQSLESYKTEEHALIAVFNGQTGRDQYDAATELRRLESQLEASYLVTSRLARLSFANYLR